MQEDDHRTESTDLAATQASSSTGSAAESPQVAAAAALAAQQATPSVDKPLVAAPTSAQQATPSVEEPVVEPTGNSCTEPPKAGAILDEKLRAAVRQWPAVLRERQASASAKAFATCTVSSFYEALAVASIRNSRCSVSLACPHNLDCPLIGVSTGFEELTGYTRSEVVGENCRFLSRGCRMNPETRHDLRVSVRSGRDFTALLHNRRKNGERFVNMLHLRTLRIHARCFILGIQADMTGKEVDFDDEVTTQELDCVTTTIVDNAEAWVRNEYMRYQYEQGGPPVPCDPIVSLEYDLLQDHLMHKNTFIERCESKEDPRLVLLSLRRVYSQPSLGFQERRLLEAGPQPDRGAWEEMHHDIFRAPPVRSGRTDVVSPDASETGNTAHPEMCTPCSFFCYSLVGCNRGDDCTFCHLEHPRKARGRRRRRAAARDAALLGSTEPISTNELEPMDV